MIPMKPKIELFLLPPTAHKCTFMPPDDMPECLPLEVIRTPQHLASQWVPNAGELALLNEGAPVTLVIYGRGMPPVSLMVGGADLR